jgi:hypothetical protein
MRKPQPLHLIIAALRKMPLDEQVSRLCALVAQERIHSVRRNELQSILEGKRLRQLKKENRSAA